MRTWIRSVSVLLALAAALVLVRMVQAKLVARHWPAAKPLVRIAEGYRAPAANGVRVKTRRGREIPLPLALAGRHVTLERAAIGDVLERAAYAPVPTAIRRKATLPEGARLMFDYGLLREAYQGPAGAVRFMVIVATSSGRTVARWSDVVTSDLMRDCRWRTACLDLSAHAGERVLLQFRTTGTGWLGRGMAGAFAMWGDPVLVGAGPKPARPNVLLIVIDALRADHLGCYGYLGRTSPNIDALSRRGTRFASALSQAPWTVPSVASMLTGRYPHQVRDAERVCLAPAAATFPQALSQRGYTCAAVTANPIGTWGVGLDRGFEYFDTRPNRTFLWRSAHTMTEHALAWLRIRARQPFFLYLHYMDPHDPYNAPDGAATARAAPGDALSAAVAAGQAKVVEELLLADSGCELSLDDVQCLRARYDREIAYVDGYIGRLLAELQHLGLRDNTAIILTADHGEEFWDHGWIRHGQSLHWELLHVPLIVVPPGKNRVARVVTAPVGLTDIGATVLELAGVTSRFGVGNSLLAAGDRSDARVVFSELGPWLVEHPRPHRQRGRSIVIGRWHLIAGDDGSVELYDLARDPQEQRDVAAAIPVQVAKMTAQMARVSASGARAQGAFRPKAGKVDEDMLRKLRALGYLR